MALFQETLPFVIPNKKDYSWEYEEENKLYKIKIPNGELLYIEHFFNKKHSDHILNYLLESESVDWKVADWRGIDIDSVVWKNILWQQDSIKMFGKTIPLPRLSAWYGDSDKPYTYSGITLKPKTWNDGLLHIKQKIEQITNGVIFNSVLINWYRDGEDYISWHTDAEPELGRNPVIGSVNFGATREFRLRQKLTKSEEETEKPDVLKIPLKHGTLLIMQGETQHFWQHAVPKESKINDLRINMTFRVIKN